MNSNSNGRGAIQRLAHVIRSEPSIRRVVRELMEDEFQGALSQHMSDHWTGLAAHWRLEYMKEKERADTLAEQLATDQDEKVQELLGEVIRLREKLNLTLDENNRLKAEAMNPRR